jgi:hypothetical protein
MRVSNDDGAHFGPVRTVAGPFNAIPQLTQPGSLRNLTAPTAVVDGTSVWLAWAQVTSRYADSRVDADIELKRSTDAGKTWSLTVPVNDVHGGDRFMPALTAWTDHSVGLTFYDRRGDRNYLNVYAARAWPGKRLSVSANVRLNRRLAPVANMYYIAPGTTCFAPGRFFGDYIGAAAMPGGYLGAVWADAQLRGIGRTDIWFTRVRMPDRARAS